MHKFRRLAKHYFIPHRSNAYRPHALRHRALSLYAILLIIFQIFFGLAFLSGATETRAGAVETASNVIARTNEARRGESLVALRENPKLTKAAYLKLADMRSKKYWDHTGPSGETAWQFIDESGYRYLLAGENLARGYDNSDEAVRAWLASPTHRANIMEKRFSEIGVAVGSGTIGGQPTILMVQLFGQPRITLDGTSSGATTVLGTSSLKPEISLGNAQNPAKMPYIGIWSVILGLVVIDGIMLRRLGLHTSKSHLYSFRAALLAVAVGVGVLTVGIVGIA